MTQVVVDAAHWLSPLGAQQYKRMIADGMPSGCLTDGGRTFEEQAELFELRYVPSSGPADVGPFNDRRGLYKGRMWKRVRGAAVAVPGTSRHESGNAIDLAEPARSWLRARPEYGFVKDVVTGEPWHFELVPSLIKNAGRAPKPVAISDAQEVTVYMIQREDNGATYRVGDGIVTHVVHSDVVNVLNYVGVKGGNGTNLVSGDDARRLIEAEGFSWSAVAALKAGECVDRSGQVRNAGRAKW